MDIEKTIQFILEQQAQFWASLQQERETNAAAHAAFEKELKRVGEDLGRVAQNQLELSVMQRQQQEMIGGLTTIVGELARGQQELQRGQQELQRDLHELQQAQRHTEGNLNALIKTVENLIRRDGRHR